MYPNNNNLLISIADIKGFGVLDVNIDEHMCLPVVKIVQDKWIEPLVGTKLLVKLLNLIESDEISLDENECYKDLLDGYLFHIMSWRVKAELIMDTAEKVRNFGIGRASDDRVYPDGFDDARKVARFYHDRADLYTQRLATFLSCKCDCFPEIKEVTAWWEKKPEKQNITHSFIYFPGKENKGCCR